MKKSAQDREIEKLKKQVKIFLWILNTLPLGVI